MDLQGTPTSGGGDGQKVTTQIPKQEGTGYVAPDSLAAESETFQRENVNAAAPGTNDSSGTGFIEDPRSLTSATGGIGHISGSGQTAPESGPGGSSSGAFDEQRGARNVDPAPSYITNVVGDLGGGPKGRNLTEGGFGGDAPSSLPEPGSKKDPGRRQVLDIEARNAHAADGGAAREGPGGTNETKFDGLDAERQA